MLKIARTCLFATRPAVIVQRATLSPSSASRQTADLEMRSASLRQTARGLTRNQTAAWSCERGTVAQSAGDANRRGLDAWRSGHADRSRQPQLIKAFLMFPNRSAPRPPLSREPSGQQVHQGVESSLWCDQMIVLINGRTNMHFTSPKSSFDVQGSKPPQDRWEADEKRQRWTKTTKN